MTVRLMEFVQALGKRPHHPADLFPGDVVLERLEEQVLLDQQVGPPRDFRYAESVSVSEDALLMPRTIPGSRQAWWRYSLSR